MTHLYIKLCDLCGKPCEVDGGLHGGNIHSDIMVKEGKASRVIHREEFDVCISCLNALGLLDILQKMTEMKRTNEQKKISFDIKEKYPELFFDWGLIQIDLKKMLK